MEYKKLIEALIEIVIREGGSDLHLAEGRVPVIRVAGRFCRSSKKKF